MLSNVATSSIVRAFGVETSVNACVASGRWPVGANASAFSTLAANSLTSLKAISSSPESAKTWNSCEASPPIEPVSAITGR